MSSSYKPVTPVKPDKLAFLLSKHPNRTLVNRLVKGFTFGFSLCYKGPFKFCDAENMSTRNLQHVLVEKVHKEVKLGRVKGPFQKPPLPNIMILPLSLVPKAGQEMVEGMAKSYRLVHTAVFCMVGG